MINIKLLHHICNVCIFDLDINNFIRKSITNNCNFASSIVKLYLSKLKLCKI